MKERLDILLVERRLVESRTKAQWLIRNGFVLVDGIELKKPGKRINNSIEIQLKKEFPYVGKGGLKLEAALNDFSIKVENMVCADIGASIGGFTDCLVKHGAKTVYAIDTAKDLLHPSLRCDKVKEKVIPMLGIDARNLRSLPENVDICTIDVTFTSIKAVFPLIKNYLNRDGDIIALIKPIFETDFHDSDKFKIITDSNKLRQILIELMNWSTQNDIFPYKIIKSPLLGKGGSIEFFINFKINKRIIFDYNELIKHLFNPVY